MSNLLMRCGPVVAVAGWLLAGCSIHTDVGASRPVHASAAQRIELPGAEGAAAADVSPVANAGSRVLPEAPEVIRLPDGTVGIKVAQQYFHTIVACRQPDGTFGTQCPPAQAPKP